MSIEMGGIIGAVAFLGCSVFYAGGHWRHVSDEFKRINGSLSRIEADIQNLFGKWDEIMRHMVTKEDCARIHQGADRRD